MPFLLKEVPSLTQYSDSGLGDGLLVPLPARHPADADQHDAGRRAPQRARGLHPLLRGLRRLRQLPSRASRCSGASGTSTVGAASFVGSINFASLDLAEKPGRSPALGAGSFGTLRARRGRPVGSAWARGLAFYGRAAYQETDGFKDHSGVDAAQRCSSAPRARARGTFFKVFGFAGPEQTAARVPGHREGRPGARPALQPDDARTSATASASTSSTAQYTRALGALHALAVQAYYNGAGGWYRLRDAGRGAASSTASTGAAWARSATLPLRGARVEPHAGARTATTSRADHTRDVVGGAAGVREPRLQERG